MNKPNHLLDSDNLDVLYRDEHIVAVNKPSGMIVHRGWDNDPVTAADIVRDTIVGQPVHALHRLDRSTSGVLIFALDKDTARTLQTQFVSHEIQKHYLALVRGPMREPCIVDHPIANGREKERVPAVTAIYPLAHQGRWSLVEAVPQSGRLHQIRRHLKHLSHHVVGDVRYGKGDINRHFRRTYNLNRLALHCFRMSLHGREGQKIVIDAALPADLVNPLKELGILPAGLFLECADCDR